MKILRGINSNFEEEQSPDKTKEEHGCNDGWEDADVVVAVHEGDGDVAADVAGAVVSDVVGKQESLKLLGFGEAGFFLVRPGR